MFPGCPEHCNAEETLSEYSRNTACRLGYMVTNFSFFKNNISISARKIKKIHPKKKICLFQKMEPSSSNIKKCLIFSYISGKGTTSPPFQKKKKT